MEPSLKERLPKEIWPRWPDIWARSPWVQALEGGRRKEKFNREVCCKSTENKCAKVEVSREKITMQAKKNSPLSWPSTEP